jgi:amino acid adenylation domain-containing protein
MQHGMLVHSLDVRPPGVDIEQAFCELREEIDVPAFVRAWHKVIERHAILRTSFHWLADGEPQQIVRRTAPLQLQHWHCSDRECDRKLEEFLQADRQKGFALGEAPLARLTLIQKDGAHFWFVFTFHHLLLDARALMVVLKEAFAFHEAFAAGRDLELPPPRPYRDYIDWLQNMDWSNAENFWRRRLKGFLAPTPLPVGRSPGEVQAGLDSRGELGLELSEATRLRLYAMVKAHWLTPTTLVQAAWALVLAGHSGEHDVVFGAIRACRRHPTEGTEATVGLFINTVPVRMQIDPEAELIPWLQNLRDQWREVREHEHAPLARVQRWSELSPGQPLFETLVNYQEPSWDASLRALGGKWQDRHFSVRNQPNYPLVVDACGGRKLVIKILFDRRRFDDDTIQRLLGHYQTVLEAFVRDPQQKLGDIPLLTESERRSLLVGRNRTASDYPRAQCVHQLFAAQAKKTPGLLAVADARAQLTYGELNLRANQLAHRLRALGVGPEVLVGVCLDRCVELVVAWLGILKAGGAFVPLDPAYPKERMAFQLQDCRAPVLLTQKRWLDALPVSSREMTVLCLDGSGSDFCREPERNPDIVPSPQNLAYVIYTSGSTGQPKGVPIEHRSLVNLVAWHQRAYQVVPRDRATHLASPAFDASVWEIWPYLTAGASVHIPDEETRLSPAKLWRWLAKNKITLTFLPTPLAEAAMSEPQPAGFVVRAMLTGGEKLNRRPPDDFPCPVFNHYGPTECTVVATWTLVEPAAENAAPPAIGRPIANTRVYVLDRKGRPVPAGAPGELWIGGDGLARGYLRRPELTAEKFITDPFDADPKARLYATGDLVRWRSSDELEFLGRLDHQVKIRGHRIELGEIESVLQQHPAVRQVVVTLQEEARGPRLVAYLVSEFKERPEARELRWLLARSLPDYMLPWQFVWLEQLPLTTHGKIDRRALPAPEAGVDAAATACAPRTPVEVGLAKIWRDVLGLQQIGIHDNFFELGGHSLLAAQVIARLPSAFKIQLPLRSLFDHPTIATFAMELKSTRPGAGLAVTPIMRRKTRRDNLPPRTKTNQPAMTIAS